MNAELIKKLVECFPQKFKERILRKLEEEGEEAATRELKLANKTYDLFSEQFERQHPHPPVSGGELTKRQSDVLEGLKQGFSVGKIARLYGLNVDSVKSAKVELHRKGITLPFSTPLKGVGNRAISQPNTHDFSVEVALPWIRGTNHSWRKNLNNAALSKYHSIRAISGMQEFFDISHQVSVKTTHLSLFLTIKNVYEDTPELCRKKAEQLAGAAAFKLQEVYGFRFGEQIGLKFKGADWAFIGHEAAKACALAGIKPETFIEGKRVMWVDDSPEKNTIEHAVYKNAVAAYKDEEARVFKGLTNETLAQDLHELSQKMGLLIEVVKNVAHIQEVGVRATLPQPKEELQVLKGRPEYIG